MDDLAHPLHPLFRAIPHYYGGTVRFLFIVAAVLIFLTESVGHDALLSPVASIFLVLLLVISAGITNPVQRWIQWFDLLLSIGGLFIFGGSALARYQEGMALSLPDFLVGLVGLIFLASLYFATRTLRGSMMQQHLTRREELAREME